MLFLNRNDSRDPEANQPPKKIRVYRNGDLATKADITLKPSITFQQLKADILRKLGLKDRGVFRLYTSEGLELYDDYIPLIKDKDSIYVSLGEEFDQTTCLGEFEELKIIGQGGFGKVVLAQHKSTMKKYAVKYVDARQYGLANLIDMVFSEAELLKNLKHKNIVEIVNFYKLRDLKVVFVMEYLEGGELGTYLKSKGRLEEAEALALFKQLVEAVHFCHTKKIIHRDLKLENILFVSNDTKTIKVVDFGIAGFYSGFKFDVSDAGSLKYMAPEILTGKNRAANPAMDVWSMGCILYQLLHGQPPFMGSSREVSEAIVRGEYKFDLKMKSKLSAECVDLIERMLVVDYTERISVFDIKKHPWLTGERKQTESLPTQEEEIKDATAVANKKEKQDEYELYPKIVNRKGSLGLKMMKEKPISNSFNLKTKNNLLAAAGRVDGAQKMPGQNTLNRAISRETKGKIEGASERQPKKLDVKPSLVEPKGREKNDVKKEGYVGKRAHSQSIRIMNEFEKGQKEPQKI